MSNLSIEDIEDQAKNEIYDLLAKGDEVARDQIVKIHENMLVEHESIMEKLSSNKISGREAARLTNETLLSSLKKMAEIVGAETVEDVFELSLDQPIQLVDPEIMGELYDE